MFQEQNHNPQTRTLAGFLYSVSRSAQGEYWPLYVGSNSIGSSVACSIVLEDVSVSEIHADLVIRKMQNKGLFAFVQDQHSKNGTKLNGLALDTESKVCANGDIIKVGKNYELYLILVDIQSIGLGQKKSLRDQVFSPVKEQQLPREHTVQMIHDDALSPFDDGVQPIRCQNPEPQQEANSKTVILRKK